VAQNGDQLKLPGWRNPPITPPRIDAVPKTVFLLARFSIESTAGFKGRKDVSKGIICGTIDC
jgi:hypothetical protein